MFCNSSRFPPDVKATVLNFILEDIRTRIDLAFSWLYEEYCFCQSFHKAQWNRRSDDTEYNNLLCNLISGVLERSDGIERDNLMTRLYLQSPMITQDAIELLKKYVLVKLLYSLLRNAFLTNFILSLVERFGSDCC